MEKSADAFRTISEVAEALETPAHVLRFWESRFPQIRPVKRAGGRRYYRPADVALLSGIRRLLHDEGMTIRGVQKILREQGVRHVAGLTDAPLEDAFDAMTLGADTGGAEPVQSGFAFDADAAAPAAEVIRPVFGEPRMAEAEAEENWPPATPPLMDQPFTETATDDLPHWGEPAPEEPAVEAEAPAAEVPEAPYAAVDDDLPGADEDFTALLGDAGAEALETVDDTAGTDEAAQGGAAAPETGDSETVAAEDDTADAPASPDAAAEPERSRAAVEASEGSEAAPAPESSPVWLPATLRALPRDALAGREDALAPLFARLYALRARVAEAAKAARK